MNILVTGGAGFIGSNFINSQINKHSNKILNYDNLTYAANLSNLDNCQNNFLYTFIKGDICDKKKMSECLSNFQFSCSDGITLEVDYNISEEEEELTGCDLPENNIYILGLPFQLSVSFICVYGSVFCIMAY